ncbi:glycoside hydrolase family 43 protein [Nocardioides daeguensis]|uniref:Glycoside hydrolase n=1 Tax=Nocardioides daeguensis TaxID=908359 RepID=A0ABP6VVZ1_9ACTN|nr:glycoside hydrolase family 43 protein [Nocardioides daeguensis]MBV6728383.1 glycoside hydrolase family 43 protein [Nocardioides daeguensis]MCR1773807.1 glycoside hydrolase family 43 protein [Nocardioides daeguensis]
MRGRGLAAVLTTAALALSACAVSGDDSAAAGPRSTEAPLIPEASALATTLPSDVLAGEMQDLAKLAERLAQQLPAQRRPEPVRIAGSSTRWQPGAAYRGVFADPDIVRYDGRWYAYATNTSHLRLPVLTSRDLSTWTPLATSGGGRVDPIEVAGWVRSSDGGRDLWAPGVGKVGDGWTAAYAAPAGTQGGQRHNCIGLTRGPSPAGPFRPVGEPICYGEAQLGVIDPDVFVDERGVPWLLWKFSGVVHRRPAGLFIRQLNADGTGFAAGSQTRELLTLDRPWEGDTIENPSMVQFRGVTYLFYSGNSWERADYATGYAICAGPEGPCVRQNRGEPLLSTASTGRLGPGGASAFVDRSSLRLVYHAWDQVGRTRQLHVAGLWQRDDGTLEVIDPG